MSDSYPLRATYVTTHASHSPRSNYVRDQRHVHHLSDLKVLSPPPGSLFTIPQHSHFQKPLVYVPYASASLLHPAQKTFPTSLVTFSHLALAFTFRSNNTWIAGFFYVMQNSQILCSCLLGEKPNGCLLTNFPLLHFDTL